MTASPQSPAPTRPPTTRTSHREVVEHVDVSRRDRRLNRRGVPTSHRRCAGGPNCLRPRASGVLSLPGSTLALAVAAVATLLGRTAP